MTEQKPIGRNRQKSARSVQPQAQQELAENLQTIAGMIELEVAAGPRLDAREELASMPDMDEEIAEIARRATDVERPRSGLPDHVIEEIATRVVLKLTSLLMESNKWRTSLLRWIAGSSRCMIVWRKAASCWIMPRRLRRVSRGLRGGTTGAGLKNPAG